jgi:hypothetical protein
MVNVLVFLNGCHKTFSVNTKTGGFLEQKTLPNPPLGRKGISKQILLTLFQVENTWDSVWCLTSSYPLRTSTPPKTNWRLRLTFWSLGLPHTRVPTRTPAPSLHPIKIAVGRPTICFHLDSSPAMPNIFRDNMLVEHTNSPSNHGNAYLITPITIQCPILSLQVIYKVFLGRPRNTWPQQQRRHEELTKLLQEGMHLHRTPSIIAPSPSLTKE